MSKINIKILDKNYLLKTQPGEEETIRRVESIIDLKIKEKNQLGIYEKQDLLSIVIFDIMMENVKQTQRETFLKEKIYKLEQLIKNVEDKD